MNKKLMSILILFMLFEILFVFSNDVFAKDDKNCSECHGYLYMRKYNDDGKLTDLLVSKDMFEKSVHAKLSCQSCHTSVKETPHKTEEIEKVDCSAECHLDDTTIPKEYRHKVQYDTIYRSVHGASFEEKDVCGCHDPHRMTRASELTPKVIINACIKCHDDLDLMQKHKVPVEPIKTYENSLHGQMIKFDELKTPNCISCHDYHNILRLDDQKSDIHKNNLLNVCKKEECHPAAKPAFANGSVHFLYRGARRDIIESVYRIFFFILIFTLIGMGLHYILDFLGQGSDRKKGFNLLINLSIILLIFASGAFYYYYNIYKTKKPDIFNLKTEFRSICYTCHGEIPHKKNKSIRAFMNRHIIKIACETCHFKRTETIEKEKELANKNDTSLVSEKKDDIRYRWYDKSGFILAGLRNIEGDDWSRIVPYYAKVPANMNESDTVLVLSDEKGKKPEGFALSRRSRICPECHAKEGLLNFKELGYSDKKIKRLEDLNVYKRMREGEKFVMPEFF